MERLVPLRCGHVFHEFFTFEAQEFATDEFVLIVFKDESARAELIQVIPAAVFLSKKIIGQSFVVYRRTAGYDAGDCEQDE